MILRALRVAGWRCFASSVEVGPFAEGLNVLYAPNATGKSTLFEALLRGLLDGHRVSGREMEAIRPWGRSLSPEVSVEFAHGGSEYRITKRFLEAAFSKLERKENGRFVPLAEGTKADEKVRCMLTRESPGSGLARPKHWGLAQVLWAPQGDLALGKLSGDVLTDIRASLGTQISGSGMGLVEKKVEEIYGQFFTVGGKLKSGAGAPALVRLKDDLQRARHRRTEAILQQQAFDETARRIEELRAYRTQAKNDEEVIKKLLREVRSSARRYQELSAEKNQRKERLERVEAQYNGLKSQLDMIKLARQDCKECEVLLRRHEEDVVWQRHEVDSRIKEEARTKAALEDTRKERKAVDSARELAEQARRYLESVKSLTSLDKQIGQIEKARRALAETKKERAGLLAPDAETLRAVREALRRCDAAQVRIDAALITLEVTPESGGSLTVVEGERTGNVELNSGSPTRVKGSPEVVVELVGVARIRAWGPTGSIEQYRNERTLAEQELDKLTMPFGVADIEKLEEIEGQARRLDRKVNEAQTRLEALLSGESGESIEMERSRARMTLAKTLHVHPDWEKTPPDDEILQMAAQRVRSSFIDKVEEAERRWEIAQSALSEIAQQEAATGAKREEATKQLKQLTDKLAKLSADGKSDEEREKELGEAERKRGEAKVRFEETERKLLEFGDDPAVAIEKLEKKLEAAGEAAIKALEDEQRERGKMQQLSSLGTYSVLVRAEEEIAKLEAQAEGEQLRVDAVRLMRDMVVRCRREAVSAVIDPVKERATRILRRIAGGKLGYLALDESFVPVAVIPGISGKEVSLESISGGEKEQVYLATRLALAEVLAEKERQLVVLDDVLTATDTGRLARVMIILEEAAQRLQVLVLTCHPERYRGLERANFINLEGIAGGKEGR